MAFIDLGTAGGRVDDPWPFPSVLVLSAYSARIVAWPFSEPCAHMGRFGVSRPPAGVHPNGHTYHRWFKAVFLFAGCYFIASAPDSDLLSRV